MLDEHAVPSTASVPSALCWWALLSAGSWSLSSSIGQFIGYLITASVISTIPRSVPTGPGDFHFGEGIYIQLVSLAVSSVCSGLIVGLINGSLQIPFLRNYQIRTWPWIGMNMIICTIVSVIDVWRWSFPFVYRQYAIAGVALLASSALLAGVYWLALRRHVPKAPLWAVSSVIGYLITNALSMIQTMIMLSSSR